MRHCLTLLLLTVSLPCFRADEPAANLPWSFRPVEKQALPAIKQVDWPHTRTDHFVLAQIETAGLKPAPVAEPRVLLRRLHFDLTGLPPTPEAVKAFKLSDLPAVVDELLASPHYGERWGRHWLDLARYTDKTASWLESTASAWLYRDWVVNAFNNDMPYPEFVRRQLANDLIPDSNPKDNAALGFLGLSPTYWKELQLPPEIIKQTVADEWEERVDALGRTFLGLTVACARCHDHKSDPITQQDYYALAGVFASVKIADRPTMSDELWAPVAKARAEVGKLEKEQAEWKKKKPKDLKEQLAKLDAEIKKIQDATAHYHVPMANGVEEAALFVKQNTTKHGTILDYQMGKARDLPVHRRGDPNTPGETVARRFLSAFKSHSNSSRTFARGSGRIDLADAITEDARPLAARVIVNRVWQHHFGRGLVATPSEFGALGDKPTHPELLDDLTAGFIDNGWSLKWLHREILLSSTWRQSSSHRGAEAKDPRNRYLARMPRQRLDIEAWRDSMLRVTGRLDATVGGEPTELTDIRNNRRTLYGTVHRRDLDKMLTIHDFPDPIAHAPARNTTITPLQQLFTLNSPFIEEQSAAFAARIAKEESLEQRIALAHQLLFQREPTKRETAIALQFVSHTEDDSAKWTQYAQALLGSNEFLFVD